MRTVTYGAACSLDGFIAPADGSMDWLHFSPEVQAIMGKYWRTVDTVLMGRRTYEVAMAQAGDATQSGTPSIASYVFSRTLQSLPQPGATLVSTDAGAFVRRLKAQPGGDICVMGGGELAAALFSAGVIDEVGLNIHPVLLGAGTPFFRDAGHRIQLALKNSRTIDGGCVIANYRVA